MHFPTDDHVLVYWPDEDSLSVIPLSRIADPPAAVGEGCQVRIGRKTFKAVTMEIGMCALLLLLPTPTSPIVLLLLLSLLPLLTPTSYYYHYYHHYYILLLLPLLLLLLSGTQKVMKSLEDDFIKGYLDIPDNCSPAPQPSTQKTSKKRVALADVDTNVLETAAEAEPKQKKRRSKKSKDSARQCHLKLPGSL